MIDATQIFDGTLPNTGAAITVTRQSTNVLDMLTGRDIGNGNALYVNVLVTEAFAASGAGTLTIDYEVCDTAGGTYLPLISSPTIGKANLIVGARYGFVIPPNQFNNATAGVLATPGRYVALGYTVATGPMTAGKVMTWISATPDARCLYFYPKNYTANVYAAQLD